MHIPTPPRKTPSLSPTLSLSLSLSLHQSTQTSTYITTFTTPALSLSLSLSLKTHFQAFQCKMLRGPSSQEEKIKIWLFISLQIYLKNPQLNFWTFHSYKQLFFLWTETKQKMHLILQRFYCSQFAQNESYTVRQVCWDLNQLKSCNLPSVHLIRRVFQTQNM